MEQQHLYPQRKAVMRGFGASSSSQVPAAASPSFSEETEFDPRLWGTLPPKLLERIIACLPPPVFFKMKTLSKSFYHLMFSRSFLELCAEASPVRHWFLLFKPGRWCEGSFFLDPDALLWYKAPPLAALPSVFSVAASAGGLLCCLSENPGIKTALVCNPLTGECVELPGSVKERFAPSVGLVLEPETGIYKVLIAGDDMISPFAVKNLTTEIYDSSLQFWTITGPLPRLCNLEQSGKMTHVGGMLYCMNYTPFAVLGYDIHRSEWNKIQAPMRRFLRSPSLVSCRGKLLMVAAVLKSKLNVPRSVRVWELQESGWVEVERMPQSFHDEFIAICNDDEFKCVGHGNFVMLNPCSSTSEIIIYDTYRKVWRWAPRCPFVEASQTLRGFTLSPRLEASVY